MAHEQNRHTASLAACRRAGELRIKFEAAFVLLIRILQNGGAGHEGAVSLSNGATTDSMEQRNTGAFADADDLLIDLTGATGTIATSNFI
jgi:hypothetical protein